MDLDISGKTALVTGASRGIGLAIAQALAAEGVRVVGAARTVTPELEAVAAAAVPVDLSTRAGARSVVDRALAVVGGIDFLVNNVGAGDPEALALGGFLDTDDEQWGGSSTSICSARCGPPRRRCRASWNAGARS